MNNNIQPFYPFFMLPQNNFLNSNNPVFFEKRISQLEKDIQALEKRIINLENNNQEQNSEEKTDMYML